MTTKKLRNAFVLPNGKKHPLSPGWCDVLAEADFKERRSLGQLFSFCSSEGVDIKAFGADPIAHINHYHDVARSNAKSVGFSGATAVVKNLNAVLDRRPELKGLFPALPRQHGRHGFRLAQKSALTPQFAGDLDRYEKMCLPRCSDATCNTRVCDILSAKEVLEKAGHKINSLPDSFSIDALKLLKKLRYGLRQRDAADDHRLHGKEYHHLSVAIDFSEKVSGDLEHVHICRQLRKSIKSRQTVISPRTVTDLYQDGSSSDCINRLYSVCLSQIDAFVACPDDRFKLLMAQTSIVMIICMTSGHDPRIARTAAFAGRNTSCQNSMIGDRFRIVVDNAVDFDIEQFFDQNEVVHCDRFYAAICKHQGREPHLVFSRQDGSAWSDETFQNYFDKIGELANMTLNPRKFYYHLVRSLLESRSLSEEQICDITKHRTLARFRLFYGQVLDGVRTDFNNQRSNSQDRLT